MLYLLCCVGVIPRRAPDSLAPSGTYCYHADSCHSYTCHDTESTRKSYARKTFTIPDTCDMHSNAGTIFRAGAPSSKGIVPAIGHADNGIKLELSSYCTRGNFYANPCLPLKGKFLCQVCFKAHLNLCQWCWHKITSCIWFTLYNFYEREKFMPNSLTDIIKGVSSTWMYSVWHKILPLY